MVELTNPGDLFQSDLSAVLVELVVVFQRPLVELLHAVGEDRAHEVLRVAVADLQQFPMQKSLKFARMNIFLH